MANEPEGRKRPAPRGSSAYPRKRAVAACQTCRSRKTKCDNRRPTCSFCESSGAACIYSTYDLSAYDPASLAILDRLSQLEENLKAHISTGLSVSSQAIAYTSSDTVTSSFAAVNTEGVSHVPASHIDSRPPQEIRALSNTVEHILRWPIFGDQFHSNLGLVDLLRQSAPWKPAKSANLDLETDACKQLLHHCFEHVLSKNPVLEEHFLRQTLNNVCMNGVGWDAESCLVLLVCALGSIASPNANQADWVTANSYFAAAQRRFGLLMAMDDLIVSQCHFLAGVYFMYSMKPLEAWRMFAQGVVCILPDISKSTPPAQYSLQECVYWSCWKSEIELRMHLDLPATGIVDTRYPQHIPEPPVTDPSQEPRWYYYLADISLRRLDLDIRDTVERSLKHAQSIFELRLAVPALEEHLQAWASSMPDVFSALDPEESTLHFILRGRLLDSYDVLYIPFLEQALALPPEHAEIAETLEFYARKALKCCVQRMEGQVPASFEMRHHGTWLALRTCARSALMLIAAQLAGRTDLLPTGWQHAVSTAAAVLSLWQEECCDVRDRLSIIRALSTEIGLDLSIRNDIGD